MWVGTHGSGLNRLDPATGRSDHFQRDPRDPDSLANDQVRAIFRDRGGRLWVGTTGGLDSSDPDRRRFVHYQHDDSPTTLGDNAIMTIGQDRNWPPGSARVSAASTTGTLSAGNSGTSRRI